LAFKRRPCCTSPSALGHHEKHVARKRAAGRYHLDFTGGGTGGYGGRDIRAGHHGELGSSIIKADAGRAGQIGPQNLDGCSHFARARLRFDEWAQTHGHAKDRATDAGATVVLSDPTGPAFGRPVQGSTRVLDQRVRESAVRVVEAVQRRQRATWSYPEDCAIPIGPATESCSVEVSVGGLDQRRCGNVAVRAVEAVQRGERASRADFEERATVELTDAFVNPSRGIGAVEVPVRALDQSRAGKDAISRIDEAVQRGELASRSDFENCPTASGIVACLVGPARVGCPVEVPVGTLDQRRFGQFAIRAVEVMQRRQRATWSDFENRAAAINGAPDIGAGVGPAVLRSSVKVPVGSLDKPCDGREAVRAVETVQRRERATWGDFEDRAIPIGPARGGCSIEVPVDALDQPRFGRLAAVLL
jgi:hypothetical protein